MAKLMRCVALTTLTALAGLGHAIAAGFMVRENSATAVGTAYAGAGSRAEAAETAFANPAGLTRLSGAEVESGATVILPSMEFRGGANVLGAPIPGGNGGSLARGAVVPNLYWAFGITNRLKGGIAVTAPFGNGTEYDSTWAGRYLGIKTSAFSADINPNIAFRLNDALSVGGGVSAQYLKVDVSSAIAQFIIFGPGAPDAYYRFKAGDWAFGFNVGVLWKIEGGTRIGITYRSGIDHHSTGTLDFTGANPLLGVVSGSASAKVRLPGTTGVSITRELSPNLSLSADVQFTQWGVFREVIIESQNPPFVNEEHYRDSWLIALGGVYRLDQSWSLMAGIAWDQTPVTERFRAVTLPDTDRYLAGVGAGYRLTDAITLEAAYQHSFALTHPSMNSSANNTDSFTHAVVLHGTYRVDVNIVAFSARYRY